jgi:hypothetical protein
MNLPFYPFRSIGNMSNRVQAKSKQVDTSVFNFFLIKMLVMEELRKTNIEWETFFTSSVSVRCFPHSIVQDTKSYSY